VKKASPASRTYRCADGVMLAVDCQNERHWKALAKSVGRPELAYTGDWLAASSSPPEGQLGRVLEAVFLEDSADVWLKRLGAQRVPAQIEVGARGAAPGAPPTAS
jgi:crotonobetainyl-CoA:carnitine CoA-transferase CaiB-like acyl-CoA transferase